MKATLAVLFVVCCYVAARPSWEGVAVAFALVLVYVADRYADAIAATSKLSETSDAMNRQAAAAQAMLAEYAAIRESIAKHHADIATLVDRHGMRR